MWLSRRKKRWGLLGADYFWTPATEQIEEVKFSVHVGLSNQRKAIYFWELLQDWLPVVWSAVINLIWLLCQTLCKPPQNCYHAVCADGHVPGCHPAKVGSSRGHKVQGKPELLWSLFPPFLSCSLYVPLPSPKGGNLIYSCPHWYYWAKCSSWIFSSINVAPSDISPVVQGDCSVGIRHPSHISCRVISYYKVSFLLSLHPSFLPYSLLLAQVPLYPIWRMSQSVWIKTSV